MSATVLPMRPRAVEPTEDDDAILTPERLTAYYVALSVQPEIAHAPAVVRATVIDRVIAGLRAASKCEDAIDARGRAQCIALIRQDAADARSRQALGGW